MKGKPHGAFATALYDGDGTPRYREGIIEAIRCALEHTHRDGQIIGRNEARAAVLREAISIVQGLEQLVHSRLTALERELDEHLKPR